MSKRILFAMVLALIVTTFTLTGKDKLPAASTSLAQDKAPAAQNGEMPMPPVATAGADASADAQIDRDVLWQVSTIDALLAGVYDGQVSFAELARHGGFGLGTFDALDGEMVAVGGKFYQVTVDGKARPVTMDQTTPFACVTHFEPELFIAIDEVKSFKDLTDRIDAYLPGKNMFYAIKVTGGFEYAKTRSVPRQKKPYPPLAEAAKHQAVFELENQGGVIVGLYGPKFVKQIGVPGYHLHYLTDSRLAGGHLLDVRGRDLVVAVDVTPRFTLILSEQEEFQNVDFSVDKTKELHKIESNKNHKK